MNSHCIGFDEYELSKTSTNASDYRESSLPYYEPEQDQDHGDSQSRLLSGQTIPASAKGTIISRVVSVTPAWLRRRYHRPRPRSRRFALCHIIRPPRSFLRKFALFAYTFFTTILVTVIVGGVFFPGYTHLPPYYVDLRHKALASRDAGRANVHNQKVFIAASIYDKDGKLCGGDWADNVLDLIELLGPENAFLSIYVNDSGPEAKKALDDLQRRVPCDHALVFEDHLDIGQVTHITAPDGSQRVKRIEYLAEVRNRALKPLENSTTTYDKLLYLNDVVFHPIDAAQLLFSTHIVADGRTDYRAACAVDFINPFKFYDTFATRDIEGYSMGLPFFPWFSANGDEQTHQDVLDGKDAVRVKSCWGGMVAFDARFFQKRNVGSDDLVTAGNQSPSNLSAPYRFRAEKEIYWDASECCLIQADIQSPEPGNSGIYMNPFVRVAYDTKTLSWLGFTRRFERLYTPIHFLLDIVTNAPSYNPRRDEEPWHEVIDTVWVPDMTSEQGGSFQQVARIATHTGFCGRQGFTVMKENITEGERNWEGIKIPSS
ncbi:hypothetical protein A1O1_07043 [Capronia coronata CBS 617.96]|uniref:Glycosyltransferase family 69 protein n=1 Tax=Capronia coronata CBS 617.96 TaxID=1182541 RepID=W9Y1D1_9EURO|nr:uncharacterized protein A1O1_07043 [Capronia coronata CBS 617.96]EXJ83420.1 hypothetical protein A1O1_07043 [Capronia coronata CBS 617.96]